MTKADTEDVRAQIMDLWRATFGEQPSIEADAETMLKVLVSCLDDVGPWVLNPQQPAAKTAPIADEPRADSADPEGQVSELSHILRAPAQCG